MRVKQTTVYHYKELSDKAKEKAREWYREGHLDYDWWDCLYGDFANRAQELGVDLRQKPVKLMNGKTRYEPEIYFSGFHHQGSGSSFSGTWRAWDMNPDKLKRECPTDNELHRISNILVDCANEDGEATATVYLKGDNSIGVKVCNGSTLTEQFDELDLDLPEYEQMSQAFKDREAAITEALRDFNRWMYQCLEKEYEWLSSDEQLEESIVSNEYEFTEDGQVA